MNEKEIVLDIHGKEYKVLIEEFTADNASVRVNGNKYSVAIKDLGIERAADVKPVKDAPMQRPPRVAVGEKQKARAQKPMAAGPENAVLSPLPGQIIRFLIREGDEVQEGQKICMLEAMKMENEVNATVSGVVIDIKFNEGDTVNQGDVLILVKPSENA